MQLKLDKSNLKKLLFKNSKVNEILLCFFQMSCYTLHYFFIKFTQAPSTD